ncbi:MAG: hypothetical protein M3Y48_14305 [Actinomycetota bacterium]|nr:hypothetical protein [Actinomycetota bacterium]
MSDALSFAEIDGQHAELLPARTVMSMFSTWGGCEAGNGGTGGAGGSAQGGLGINVLSGIGILGTGIASAGDATGGAGGSADGGSC